MSSVTTTYVEATGQSSSNISYTGGSSIIDSITDGTRPSTPADSTYIYQPTSAVYGQLDLTFPEQTYTASIPVDIRAKARYRTSNDAGNGAIVWQMTVNGNLEAGTTHTSGESSTWFDWASADYALVTNWDKTDPVTADNADGTITPTLQLLQAMPVTLTTARRYSEMWLEVDTTVFPTASVTISGTQTTATPTLGGTYSDTDGWAHSASQWKVFESAVYSDPAFDTDTSTAAYDTGFLLKAEVSHTVTTPLDATKTYKTAYRVAKTVNGVRYWSSWSLGTAWTIDIPTPDLGFTGAYNSTTQAVDFTCTASLNLLDDDTSYAVSTVGDWVGTNATLTASSAQQLEGSNSVLMTVDATAGGASMTGGTEWTVAPSTQYTLSAYVRGSAAKNCEVSIEWLTSASATISTSTGTGANCGTGDWDTRVTVTATSPATAAYAVITCDVNDSVTAADTYYWDCIQLATGGVTEWAPKPTAARLTVTKTVDGATLDVWDATAVSVLDYYAPFTLTDHEPDRAESGVTYEAYLAVTTSLGNTARAENDSVTMSSDSLHWIKVLDNPDLNAQVDLLNEVTEKIEANVGIFRPLDATKAIVVSGPVWGADGSLPIFVATDAEWVATIRPIVLHSGTVGLLNIDGQRKRVRWVGREIDSETAGGDIRREVSLEYVEVS